MEQLVVQNQGLVARSARKYLKVCYLLTLEELMAEGSAGIVRAARKFDPARGVKFSTYACWWIRHEVERAVQDTDTTVRIPVRVHADAHTLYLGKSVSPSRRGLVDAANRVRRLVSLDAPIGPEDAEEGRTRGEGVAGPGVPQDELVEEKREVERVWAAVESLGLTVRERAVLERRVMGDETLEEVAQTFRCSRERIRQIQVAVAKRIRAALGTE